MSCARMLAALGLANAVAGAAPSPAAADPEIAHKIAVLRSLAPGASAAAARAGRGRVRGEPAPLRHSPGGRRGDVPPAPPAHCSPAGARRLERAELSVTKLRAIHDASLRYAVSANLIRSVIRHESAGDPGAVSHKGAMGLMQLMPATARALGVVCAFDPRQNVMGGTRYLREMRDLLGSWRLAIAAYHAGPQRARTGRLPRETRRYVERVLGSWRGG